jgi:hypothetical protein
MMVSASSEIMDHQFCRGAELISGAATGAVRIGRLMDAGWPTFNRSEIPGN